jgi:2-dehydropantoate 2-reductase
MRAVVVGAGAVGQVYAEALKAGGAEVAFKVRNPGKVTRPFRLYPLRGDRTPRTFDVPVFGTDEEVAAFAPDLVLITVPSDALHGDWLGKLLAATGSATVVTLTPGLEDLARIRAAKPGVELTQGIIALIAYQAPLPGETYDPPGIAYYVPPATAMPFEGPAAERIAEVLTKGGLKSAARTGLATQTAYGAAAMGIYVTALRAAGWKFAGLDRELMRLAGDALSEANAVVAAKTGQRRPFSLGLVGNWSVSAMLWAGQKILPLPLETYIGVHFTKVGEQTKQSLEGLAEAGEARSIPVPSLRTLIGRAFPPAAA